MDYKKATIHHMFRNARKYRNPLEKKMSQLPKGWIYITKNGTYDTMTPEEREKFSEGIKNRQIQQVMDNYVARFVSRKREELERDGYTEEEIEAHIEDIFYKEEESYDTDGYDDDEYYSSDSYDN